VTTSLPENVFICYADEVQIYCIWLLSHDSKLVLAAWPSSNKNVNYKKKVGWSFVESNLNIVQKNTSVITTSSTETIIEPL
jgi:hypothetical protein